MSDAAFDIAAEGMAAERSAMDVIAQRLATGSAVVSAPGALGNSGSAYVPASFSSALDNALSPEDPTDLSISFAGDMQWASASSDMQWASVSSDMQWASASDAADSAPGARGLEPRAATAQQPDGDPIGQMIALVATGRAYDADVAALQAAKQMDVEASDIDKF
jgi:flagellar basal body rod protein FlgC